jgi:hypothetical protein
VASHQASRKQGRPGRRYRLAGALFSVAALITAGSLALALSGHSATATAHSGREAGPGVRDARVATRNLAAAWVADQVSRAAIVSCDPVMCQALKSHGVPARQLSVLGPEPASPLGSQVIVATPVVRARFGDLLASVYAPAVIASLGSGRSRIDIRQIAPDGAAAYRRMLHADLLNRKAAGAQLLHNDRIAVSATARRLLSAGQVDSRLLMAIVGMAAVHPVYVVTFGSLAPGASPGIPLRFAEVTQAGQGVHATSRSATPAFVRSMTAFLRAQHTPFLPLRTETVRTALGQAILRVEFAAPSPLGLLGLFGPLGPPKT